MIFFLNVYQIYRFDSIEDGLGQIKRKNLLNSTQSNPLFE